MSENAQAQSTPEVTPQPEPQVQAAEAASSPTAELEAQLKEKDAKYLYLYAEFENFKKRNAKERMDLLKFGWEPIARDLLQIADNMDLAIQHAPANTDKNFAEGLRMTLKNFRDTLQRQGVQLLETLQKSFDPEFHEAISEEDSEHPAGTIVKEHTKGYTLHGRLLRPARVTVSAGKKH